MSYGTYVGRLKFLAVMASAMAAKRLRKEYIAIKKNPIDNIVTVPLDSNILDWHYVIIGTSDTPYVGGYYHGLLRFPPEYPMKPPSVLMLTPNGRFKTNQRLCLSMSDFHPETWNPMWSIEHQSTLGSVVTSDAQKRKYAANSLEYNCMNRTFRKLFPDFVEVSRKKLEADRKKQMVSKPVLVETKSAKDGEKHASNRAEAQRPGEKGSHYIMYIALVIALFAVLVCFYLRH